MRHLKGVGLWCVVMMTCSCDTHLDEDYIDPGRVTIHRLNRVEFNNTVKDLLNYSGAPGNDFPADDHGYGFDNIADVLTFSPVHGELIDLAAERMLDEIVPLPQTFRIEAESLSGNSGARHRNWGWKLWGPTPLDTSLHTQEPGEYVLSIKAQGQVTAGIVPKVAFLLSGEIVGAFDIDATGSGKIYSITVSTESTNESIGLVLLNPQPSPTGMEVRSAIFDWISVEGPLINDPQASERTEHFLPCTMNVDDYYKCAEQTLKRFVGRVWRRPVAPSELSRLMHLVDDAVAQEDSPQMGVRNAMHAALLSPNFIYRVELDPDPTSMKPRWLSSYELASRLSYFIWSSMPDEELLQLADDDALQNEAVIEVQVRRMLADPRAKALTENFAGQWLSIRAVNSAEPNQSLFPDFDEELRAAIKQEASLFFEEFLKNDLPVTDMFTANYTFANDRLAQHYGLSANVGEAFTKVSTEGTPRSGILTLGAYLMATAYPTRTSPVQRGRWVLRQLLCVEPPPPPGVVSGLANEVNPTGTIRERMQEHSQNPVCASCHVFMDPIGFGLENFDPVAKWRDTESGFPIDATGKLPTGETFLTPNDLSRAVSESPLLTPCITSQLYIYALGRGVEDLDKKFLVDIEAEFVQNGKSFSDLIVAVTKSLPFRMRRGEPNVGEKQ